ncbi:MAG: hypothetical protein FD170_560 [Bacteroidetes bacterium]|nr:MAG: hypothetical protein FD170_560 [Bacteroidota bacterium]
MKIKLRQVNGLRFSLFPDLFYFFDISAVTTIEIFQRYIFQEIAP